GIKLKYKFAIATANDSTYKATFKLDGALLDRFFCVIPVPTTDLNASNESFAGADALTELILLNTKKRKENLAEAQASLIDIIKRTHAEYKSLCSNADAVNNVIDFTAKFFAIIMTINEFKTSKVYISPRQIGAQFPKLVLAIAAYYKAIEG